MLIKTVLGVVSAMGGAAAVGATMRENYVENSEEALTFDNLGNLLNTEYMKVNKNNSKSELQSLSGKQDFKKVFESKDYKGRLWKIIQIEGKDCTHDVKKMENFCGFVGFTKGDEQYKLKVASTENKGSIKVVKKLNDQVSYYKHSTSNWVDKIGVKFEELHPFDPSRGTQFEEDSIFINFQTVNR